MTENGSKQFEQKNENRLNINDYPLEFDPKGPLSVDGFNTPFQEFDDQINFIEEYIGDPSVRISAVLPDMETLYKVMELYYRIKLIRKTIKEQIENENK